MARLIRHIKTRLQTAVFRRERIVIYTVAAGNYDPIRVPQLIKPNYDYVAYVDDADFAVPYPWQRRQITISERSPRVTSRYYKLHPHVLFPEYRTSVYLDASLEIQSDFDDLIKMSLCDHDIAQYIHPHRDCIYEEAKVVVDAGLDTEAVVAPQIQKYRQEGYPEHNGLFASGLIIRAHHTPTVKKTMEAWWQEVKMHSHRDQISGKVVLWRNSLNCYPIQGSIFSNQYVVFTRDMEKAARERQNTTSPQPRIDVPPSIH